MYCLEEEEEGDEKEEEEDQEDYYYNNVVELLRERENALAIHINIFFPRNSM